MPATSSPKHPLAPSTALRPALLALSSLLVVQLLFGVWPVIAVLVMEHVSPRVLIGTRLLGAAPLLLLLVRPWRFGMSWREILSCAGLGFLGIALNQILFVEGLARSTPLNSAILGCLIPVYTAGLALLLGRERPRPLRLVGLALGLGGALFLVGAERLDLGPDRMLGNLMLMSNTFVYSAYLVLARPLFAKYGALPVLTWVFAWAVPMGLPYAWHDMVSLDWAHQPPIVWGGLAYIVFGATILAYALNAVALRHVTASTVAVFVYLQPLITGLTAHRVLDSRPDWHAWVSAALIFAGIALVTREGTRRLRKVPERPSA